MAVANPFGEKYLFTQARSCHMLFVLSRKQNRTVSFIHPKGKCSVCFEDDGLKMKCGHYICPNDLLDHAWMQVAVMKYEITCTKCSKIISPEDIIQFGIPNKEEELFFITAITTNFYESQDIKECPQCHTLCSRLRTDTAKVHCTICPKKVGNPFMFCWYCLKGWRNMGNHQICGNANCMRESIETLRSCPKKDFIDAKGKIISIPKWRACPNKRCSTLIEHTSECNTMTCCKCSTRFCFICLSVASGRFLGCQSVSYNKYIGITCVPAPIQTKL